jgi:hypothetical protein
VTVEHTFAAGLVLVQAIVLQPDFPTNPGDGDEPEQQVSRDWRAVPGMEYEITLEDDRLIEITGHLGFQIEDKRCDPDDTFMTGIALAINGKQARALIGTHATQNAQCRQHYREQIRYNDDPNDETPDGVSTTWTEVTSDQVEARALDLRDSTTVGAAEGSTSTSAALPNHVHSDGTLAATGTASDTTEVASAPNEAEVLTPTADRDVQGDTGNPTASPTITMDLDPLVVMIRAWRRTA